MQTRGDYGHLTYDELHDLCERWGYARTDLKAASETRLATKNAVGCKRNCDVADAMDIPETLAWKRNRGILDAMDISDDLPLDQEKRRPASDLHLAFFVSEGKVQGRAQRWGLEVKACRDARRAPPLYGVDAATCARTAGNRSRVLGPDLTGAEDKVRGGCVNAA